MNDVNIGGGRFMLGDCLERMREIPDGSVDMILCDLPYGTTQNKWDQVIPFEPLWREYWRVAKPGAAVVLTASQPFTSALVMSQAERFKHEWIWDKVLPTGFAIAKYSPLKQHESVLVFARKSTKYNPQMVKKDKARTYNRTHSEYKGSQNLKSHDGISRTLTHSYPRSILKESNADQKSKIHPTQKPVALFEYLIQTYTDAGITVLDNCAGSGTTAIAAERTGRKWICIERDPEYYAAACNRIRTEIESRGLFA